MRHNDYNFEFELFNKQRLNIEGECLPEGEPETLIDCICVAPNIGSVVFLKRNGMQDCVQYVSDNKFLNSVVL